MRPSGRAPDALRPVFIQTGFARHAEGSALIRMGGTEVLCAASVEPRVPSFLRGKGPARFAPWWTSRPWARSRSRWIATC